MNPSTKTGIARGIIAVCRRMAEAGHVVATEGNVSARLRSGNILLTGTAVTKRSVTGGDLVEVTPGGKKVSGKRSPSSEARMHLYLYARRPDVGAIVHAHPVTSTGFAVARVPIPVTSLPEVIVEFGRIPAVPYATPSTKEVTDAIARYVKDSDVFLLANHGIVACGKDLEDAYEKLERVEHAARIMFIARMLGGEKPLTPGQLRKLRRIRGVPPPRRHGLPGESGTARN